MFAWNKSGNKYILAAKKCFESNKSYFISL